MAKKKKTVKKTASKKKVSKRGPARSKATKRSSTKKKTATASKASKKKKVTKKATKKSGKSPRAVSSSMPSGSPFDLVVNGVNVVTPDGKKVGKRGAQGYVEGSRIKPQKFIRDAVRSEGLGEIDDIVKSVRANGILQPLVVRPAGDGKTFDLIAGERRLTSAKKVGGKTWEHVPVIIRTELQGDDDAAIAAAFAENADDVRKGLNIVDIGVQAVKYKKKGWSTDRMSKEMGLHVKKVRRALGIVEMPKPIQERVRKGEIAVNTAIEVVKCSPAMQKKLAAEIGPGTVASDVRNLRKKLDREAEAAKTAKGESLDKKRQHSGEASTAPKAASWMKPTEKSLQISQFAHAFVNADDNEIGSTQWHELRGCLGGMLRDRGDIADAMLPSIHKDEWANPTKDAKVNEIFNGIVANEAARHEARATN